MNLAFRREALPLMYLPLMGQGQPYDRFDDIWGGILAKRACDLLGWHIAVGHPVVDHHRASDPFVNLVKEAAGIKVNEAFWERVDRGRLPVWQAVMAPRDVMNSIGVGLEIDCDPYTKNLGRALQRWTDHASKAIA
jgi:reversibly glycosylated polypeptide/UDP-arabinopyranose mutase